MRIIFAGTTEFGIPTLEKLLTLNYQLLTVVTQPDQPSGRNRTLTPPPIKLWAERHAIPVLQFEKIVNLKSQISNLNLDLLLVAAFGQIIPKEILDIPKFGSINIHASLLPKYRGATPIQAALLNGDKTTGITLIKMDEKMDHGAVIACASIDIDDKDDYNKLHTKLSLLAAALVDETLPAWFANKIIPQPQDESNATYVKLLRLNDAKLDWTKSALQLERMIRALNPEPGVWTTLDKKSVKILEARAVDDSSIELPGKILERNKQLLVKCQTGALEITRIQPEGRRPMSGKDFLNGLKNRETKLFI